MRLILCSQIPVKRSIRGHAGLETDRPPWIFCNGTAIADPVRKQWQSNEYINCQEHYELRTKARVDCYALNVTNSI